VGQNLQAKASDTRALQTYEDAEAVLHEALEIQKHLQAQDAVLERLLTDAAAAAGTTVTGLLAAGGGTGTTVTGTTVTGTGTTVTGTGATDTGTAAPGVTPDK
jgi:hypothetical protein